MKQRLYGIIGLLIMTIAIVSAGPVTTIPIVTPTNPVYTMGNVAPNVYMSVAGAALNPVTTRTNKYAFTGEQLDWKVLVSDVNGIGDIKTVVPFWVSELGAGNCIVSTVQPSAGADLSEYGVTFTFNTANMKVYSCSGSITPSLSGDKHLIVRVTDQSNAIAETNGLEHWYLNPELDVTISGTVNFGQLSPGQQAATTLSLTNSGEDTGVQVILSIAGTNFYDPTTSGAMCPTSNYLPLQGTNNLFVDGFWYSAVMGSNTVNHKRIPYATSDISTFDPIFSSSNAANNWRDWTTGLVPIDPGADVTLTLNLGLPNVCYGYFTEGDILLGVSAI